MRNLISIICSCVFIFNISACTKKTDDAVELVTIEATVAKGDSADRVYELLGEPSIEFPQNGKIIRIYEKYEVTFEDDVAVVVRKKDVENAETRRKREEQASLAEEQLRSAYKAVAQKNKKEHEAWLARQEQMLEEKRRKEEKVEAYNERVSDEKRTKIIADAIKKSCGCRHGHCHH